MVKTMGTQVVFSLVLPMKRKVWGRCQILQVHNAIAGTVVRDYFVLRVSTTTGPSLRTRGERWGPLYLVYFYDKMMWMAEEQCFPQYVHEMTLLSGWVDKQMIKKNNNFECSG